jgi:two-component system cell cycle sensor histidine kinase/response regulator CckA
MAQITSYRDLLYRPFNQLMAVLSSNQRTEDRDLPFWRERILKSILVSGLVLSLLAYLPVLRIAFQEGFWDLALVDSFAYLIILLCLRFEKIKFEYRTLGLLALIYLLGFFIILKMGLSSGGPAWLFSAAVLAGVLLGLRMALVALAVNAFAIFAIGWLISTGYLGPYSGLFQSLERGFAAGANFIFLNAVTSVSVAALVGGLESTTRQKELTAKKLDQERAGLIRAKVSLRNEVEERKASEAALRESELRYKLLAENVTDVIWTVDFGLRFTYVSPSVEKLLGYQAHNLLTQPVVNFLAPESQNLVIQKTAQLSEKLEKNVNQPFDLQNLEIQMIRKDGVKIWTEIQNSFFLTSQGEVAGIIGVARDITKRKEYEEALKESENKYRNILESIDEGYYEVDRAGNFTFVNRAVCEILGYSKEELIGLNNRDYTTVETSKKLFKTFNSAFLSGKPKQIMDYEIIMKDGDVRILELSTALIKDDAGNQVGFRGIARDITKRKQSEKEKVKLEKRLMQAERMKVIGTLAGGVAHDLNNVLSGIVSYPELLLLDLAPDNPMVKPIKTIQESGIKAAAIVEDLLTLARRGVSVSEIVNLNDVVGEYLLSPEHQRLIHFHPLIEIESQMDTSLLNVLGSPIHLSKTVMNLVSNAAEAMPDGGKVVIKTKNQYIDYPINGYDKIEEGDYCVVTVSDTGIGLAPEELPKIFEPFYTKKVMGRSGTGLGMAVVWGTVKDHKGYIEINSTLKKGTVFKLYFPATRQNNFNGKTLVSMDDYKGDGETVLVVDDVIEQREIASKMLFQLGYKVDSVSSGEEAIQYIRSKPADLIVLDMIMAPGIDGLDTFKQISRLTPRQKAIITSGFSETRRVKEAQILGAGEYVKKPYSLEKIGLAVRNELGRQKEASCLP